MVPHLPIPTRYQIYGIVIDDNVIGDNFRITPSHGPSVIKIKNIVTVIFRRQYRSPGHQNRSIQDRFKNIGPDQE